MKAGKTIILLLLALVSAAGFSATAEEPIAFSLPVDCSPGVDCWVVKYVDLAEGPDSQNYNCSSLVTNKHTGTDFAVRTRGNGDDGIPVLAAAPGRVWNFRDGMEDAYFRDVDPASLKGRSCGNYVAIDHGDGWITRYCHLRYGSVIVFPGTNVHRGEQIGLVGLSGLTAFPNLHLTVFHNRQIVDPFSGKRRGERCGAPIEPLWDADTGSQLQFQPVVIVDAGLTAFRPDRLVRTNADLRKHPLVANEPIYLWADIFGSMVGDSIQFTVSGADGQIARTKTMHVSATRFRKVLFMSWQSPKNSWPAGEYTAEVKLLRGDGSEMFQTSASVKIEMQRF